MRPAGEAGGPEFFLCPCFALLWMLGRCCRPQLQADYVRHGSLGTQLLLLDAGDRKGNNVRYNNIDLDILATWRI